MIPVEHPYRESGCYFCGPMNPIGPRLTFQKTETEPTELVCQWIPPAHYQGFGKVLHGGIQSGLLDEIMGWTTLHLTQQIAVTASLSAEFLKPIFVERPLEMRCRIQAREGSRIHLTAEICNEQQEICTRGQGTYVLLERERFERVVGEP